MNLYPLKFYPILKERLWGGTKLGTLLGKELESDLIGESWELSGVGGDVSIVANGSFKGTTLTDLINRFPEEILGKSVLERFGKEFPILIKFIDAQKIFPFSCILMMNLQENVIILLAKPKCGI